jgi:hypothetical protein
MRPFEHAGKKNKRREQASMLRMKNTVSVLCHVHCIFLLDLQFFHKLIPFQQFELIALSW